MFQLWRTKPKLKEVYRRDDLSEMKVLRLKKQAHQQIKETDETAKRLNKILKADGITLKIYVAKGGYSGR